MAACSKTEELLQCPLCLERFIAPRTLPCEHSFCLACLESIWPPPQLAPTAFPTADLSTPAKLRQPKAGGRRFADHTPTAVALAVTGAQRTCPICRAEYLGLDFANLKASRILTALLEIHAAPIAVEAPTPPSLPPQNKCNEHGSQLLLTCLKCHKPLCFKCSTTEKHRNHRFKFVEPDIESLIIKNYGTRASPAFPTVSPSTPITLQSSNSGKRELATTVDKIERREESCEDTMLVEAWQQRKRLRTMTSSQPAEHFSWTPIIRTPVQETTAIASGGKLTKPDGKVTLSSALLDKTMHPAPPQPSSALCGPRPVSPLSNGTSTQALNNPPSPTSPNSCLSSVQRPAIVTGSSIPNRPSFSKSTVTRSSSTPNTSSLPDLRSPRTAAVKPPPTQTATPPLPAITTVATVDVECPMCLDRYSPEMIEAHASLCEGTSTYPEESVRAKSLGCPICHKTLPAKLLPAHAAICEDYFEDPAQQKSTLPTIPVHEHPAFLASVHMTNPTIPHSRPATVTAHSAPVVPPQKKGKYLHDPRAPVAPPPPPPPRQTAMQPPPRRILMDDQDLDFSGGGWSTSTSTGFGSSRRDLF